MVDLRRKTAIDGWTTCHRGYAICQTIRKRIEEVFGWGKTVGGLTQVKLRQLENVQAAFLFGLTAYDLVRLHRLLAIPR